MMLRYLEFSEIRKDLRGRRYYGSIKYPRIPPKDSDIYIFGKRGMRLDLLAAKYYDDVTLWPILARCNRIGYGTINVPVGTRIRIPYPLTQEEIVNQFSEINEI